MIRLLSFPLFFSLWIIPATDPAVAFSSERVLPQTVKLGIAITPRHFPSHTAEDVEDAFQKAKRLGDYAVFIYQWHELDLQVASLMVSKSKQAGMNPILGLSPTTLNQGRRELDLPPDLRRRAGPFISFANPVVRKAFRETVKNLARLRPPYLCIATEINFLALPTTR